MFETLEKRRQYAINLKNYLASKYDLSDTQIFIFGSFLTENFIPNKSDIDIGLFSENKDKMYDIYFDLDEYIQLDHDIIIMNLSDKLLINIPIIVYGETLTAYYSDTVFQYLQMMVKKYGFLEKGLEISAYE